MEEILKEQIEILREEMKKTDPTSEEYESMRKSLIEYGNHLLAIQKQRTDAVTGYDELAIKRESVEASRKADMWQKILTGAGIVISAAITVWGAVTTFKFEETGSICSMTGRNMINNLFRNKK